MATRQCEACCQYRLKKRLDGHGAVEASYHTRRRLCGSSCAQAVLRCAVPIGQVDVTHLSRGFSSRQRCKVPGASPGNASSFVNATSPVVFSCDSVKSQDFCKLGFRHRTDVMSGQLFIATVRADENKSREAPPRSLSVHCEWVSSRDMD